MIAVNGEKQIFIRKIMIHESRSIIAIIFTYIKNYYLQQKSYNLESKWAALYTIKL